MYVLPVTRELYCIITTRQEDDIAVYTVLPCASGCYKVLLESL